VFRQKKLPPEEDASSQPTTSKVETTVIVSDNEDTQTQPITEVYEFGRQLGSGAFSIVIEATNKKTGERVAIKRMKKKTMDQDLITSIRREITNLKKVNHPHIMKLYGVFEDDEELCLVMELIVGQELFDKIVERGHYTEKDTSHIVRQVIDAIAYLHAQGIAHRDLKPENLLSSGENENEIIKVADFGLSKNFSEEKLHTSCGSPTYVAPEVLNSDTYDKSVDMWSIGVITYILLSGYPPFYGDTQPELFKRITAAQFDFDDDCWNDISSDAKDLIRHLLVKDPKQRYTAQQALEHPWIQGTSAGISNKNMNLLRLREFQTRSKIEVPQMTYFATPEPAPSS